MAEIRMRKVNKAFGKAQVIRDLDLEIASGELCVFVGPSGCGKSTLLRLIAGLEEITSGDLFIGADRVNEAPPRDRGVAMVFQSYALYPHMSVYENMAFGLKLARTDRQSLDERVREAARMLQIDPLLGHLPKQLSGGQRQRVAIGRAIVRHPRVFLLDEPLSNLDAALRVQTRMEIARLHKRLKATMVYVTHDQVEAMTLADKIVVLRDGRVEQVGSPLALYRHPHNRFVAGFIGSPTMNFLESELVGGSDEGAAVRLVGGVDVRVGVAARDAVLGAQVTLGIRPEHLVLGEGDGAVLEGRVIYSEHLGDQSLVYVEIPGADTPLTVRVDPDTDVEEGRMLSVGLPANACHLFDGQGTAFRRLAHAANRAG